MARVSTYVNTMGRTEEAFLFYAGVFGTEVTQLTRFSDVGMNDLPGNEHNLVMHAEVPILAGHMLMGTDMLESAGHALRIGNNTTINLEPDTRADADRIWAQLSMDATETSGGLADMPWGAYWGTCLDRFGIRWMFNVANQQ